MKQTFFVANMIFATILFVVVVALSSASEADAQGGGTREARQTNIAGTSNAAQENIQGTVDASRANAQATGTAVRANASSTTEAVQTNIASTASAAQTNVAVTVEAAQTDIAATRTVVQENISSTATYVATAIQQTREDYQATATAVVAQIQTEIAAQVAALLEDLEAQGVIVNIEADNLYVTVERTEAQTTDAINAALDQTGYAMVTASMDYVAPDTAILLLEDVPTEVGPSVDYTLVYVLSYDSTTEIYSLVLVEVRINGISAPVEEYDEQLVNGVTVVVETYTSSLENAAPVGSSTEVYTSYDLSYDLTSAYITDNSYVVSFAIDLSDD